MERLKKADWVKCNLSMVKEGVKLGTISYVVLRDFDVYRDFKKSTSKSKMQIYSKLSAKYKISEISVRMIIAKMSI